MDSKIAITTHLVQRFKERVDNEATVEDIEKSITSALSTLPVFVDLKNNSLIFVGEYRNNFFSIAGKVDNGTVVGITILDIDKFSWGAESKTKRKWANKEDAVLALLVACNYSEREIAAIMCYSLGKVHERMGNLRRKTGLKTSWGYYGEKL